MFESDRDQDIRVDHELNEGELSEFAQSRRLLKLMLVESVLVLAAFFAWLAFGASPLWWVVLALCAVLGLGAALAGHLRTRKEERDLMAWLPRLTSTKTAIPLRLLALGTLAFLLWAITAVLGLWMVEVIVTQIWPPILLAFTEQMPPAQREGMRLFSSYCWLMLLGIVWLVLVIASAEYHRKRVGRPGSWRLFAVTLAAEGAILITALLV